MFGNELSIGHHFADFRIDYFEIPGTSYANATNRYTFRISEMENIWEYYLSIIQRLRLYADNVFVEINQMGVGIEESPKLDALREALVNMLMHADYFSPMHSTVRVFTNRIEFQNAGRFMFDLKDLRVQMHSMPRNPLLVKLFRFAKLSENAGYGIDRMLTWEKLTNNSVEFSSDLVCSTVTYFRTVTTADSNNITENHPGESTEKSTEKSTGKSTGKNTEKSTEKILLYIRKKPTITIAELCEVMGMSDKGIRKNINVLKQKGILVRVGPDKGGHWNVVEPLRATTNNPINV